MAFRPLDEAMFTGIAPLGLSLVGDNSLDTRAWLDHLATRQPFHLATPTEARQNLEVTLAIEEADPEPGNGPA